MKPEYVNYFIVNKNDKETEVIINMNHGYHGVETKETEEGLEINTKSKIHQVGSIVMTIEDAKALRDLLTNLL